MVRYSAKVLLSVIKKGGTCTMGCCLILSFSKEETSCVRFILAAVHFLVSAHSSVLGMFAGVGFLITI